MSDLYNNILKLIHEYGIREYRAEEKNVMSYLVEESKYILGLTNGDMKEVVVDTDAVQNEMVGVKVDEFIKEVIEEEVKNNKDEEVKTVKGRVVIKKGKKAKEERGEEENKSVEIVREEIVEETEELTQRQKEKRRREYMKENGIKLEDVMTVEKIGKLIKEGKSYAWIASEYTGTRQEEVSRFAKLNGLI
jgi:hypothetical protein